MAINSFFKIQVLQANQGKTKIVKKQKEWLYPHSLERMYHRKLADLFSEIEDIILYNINNNLPSLVSQAKQNRPDSYILKLDDYVDQLESILQSTKFSIDRFIDNSNLNQEIERQALDISAFNKAQFIKVIQSAVSVNPIINELYLPAQIKSFVQQNTDLITNLTAQQNQRITNILYQGLNQGESVDTLQNKIKASFNFTDNRIALIAQDQTSKFNGQLTQLRQNELGVDEYIWRTVQDERVRASHASKEGRVFQWSNPPADTGHPSNDVRCRCHAQPIITDAMFEN